MHRKYTPAALLFAAAAMLAGCEHATGVQQRARTVPDPVLVQSVTGMDPAELAVLLDMAGGLENAPVKGVPWHPPMPHPLDGLTPEQVQQLFTAAGLSAEKYAARWLYPCDSCARVSGAR